MLLASVLAVAVGVVLGLLGGGGSILAVPLFVYGLDMAPKEAIATSLLVVGVTSVAGLIQYARRDLVNWRTGAVFSAFAMAGAYLGGRAAAFVPGSVLLGLFAAMMIATGIAMLRSRESGPSAQKAKLEVWKIALEGIAVGAVTGLVGAGGGFLVVPALVLLGGMDMKRAIGTSLMIIALKAFTGLWGHLSHVSINLELAAVVSGMAVAGTLIGTLLSKKLASEHLRKAFGWFVFGVAGLIVYKEAPPTLVNAVFVERWPFWAGGAAIGSFLLAFLRFGRQMLGVSTGFDDVCAAPFEPEARRSWRLPFMIGIVLGGLLAAVSSGGVTPTIAMGAFDSLWHAPLGVKAGLFTFGGVLIGFGTRLAGGCTSGHGISGVAQLAPSSLIATATFMTSGFVTTQLVISAIGS